MKQGRSTALMAGILSVFSLSQCLGGITPVIARIGAAFPDIPSTTVMYVSTAASLAGIPASLIAGQIAGRRLSLRAIAILSTVVILVCGCIPALIPLFPVLLITRALFGFGMGAISVLGNPLVSEPDRQPQLRHEQHPALRQNSSGLINEDCISWVGSMPALLCIVI